VSARRRTNSNVRKRIERRVICRILNGRTRNARESRPPDDRGTSSSMTTRTNWRWRTRTRPRAFWPIASRRLPKRRLARSRMVPKPGRNGNAGTLSSYVVVVRAKFGLIPGQMGRHAHGMRSRWRSFGRFANISRKLIRCRSAEFSAAKAVWSVRRPRRKTNIACRFPFLALPWSRTGIMPPTRAAGNRCKCLPHNDDGVFGRDRVLAREQWTLPKGDGTSNWSREILRRGSWVISLSFSQRIVRRSITLAASPGNVRHTGSPVASLFF